MGTTPAPRKVDVIKRIQDQLGRYDREPFRLPLATALANAPGNKNWKRLAKADPDKWARAIGQLAKTAGFAEVKEVQHISNDPEKLARELVARFGHTRARQLIAAAGLPVSLIPVITIDNETQDIIPAT